MPKYHKEILKQSEEEKQPIDNKKNSFIKKNMKNVLTQENNAPLVNGKNNQVNNKIHNNNLQKKSFNKEIIQNANINNNLESNLDNNMNDENLIDSETYIIDDNEPLEKPPNAIEISDLLGEKCELDLDILSISFSNFEPSKTSSKTMGIIKAYGANTYQGLVRNYNEDRVSIIINMARPKNYTKNYWPKTSFFGIYDGHGGSMCSEFLRDCLHKLILNDINFPENIELAIKNGFLNAEKTFLSEIALDPKDENIIADRSGSCAVVVLVVDKKIYVANVGDSRALFSQKKGKSFVVVTDDHKPNNDKERKRIIQNGGHVYQSRTVISGAENENLNGQILYGPYRVLPGRLSVSRTIGDIEAKSPKFGGNPNVIIWEPDIFIFDLNKIDTDFFIMGCDGIFDQMSNKEIMECAWMILNNKNANDNNKENKNDNNEESFEYNFENINIHEKCGLIVDFIIKSSMVRKSFDNVTCLMIAFKDFIPKENINNANNSISTEEYLKNIYRLNNSVNNKINSDIKKELNKKNNKDNAKKKIELIHHQKEQNVQENNNIVYNSGIITNSQSQNINIKKINNKKAYKELPKNIIKANLKLTNFINTKNNNMSNDMNEFFPRSYRNTDPMIIKKINHKTNNNIISNNNVYIKKRKERNLGQKSTNKTDINNPEENRSNSNIIHKKLINKIDSNRDKKVVSNDMDLQNINNNFQIKKKRVNTGGNCRLDGSQSQNELLNQIYPINKSKNENNINNNLIQKLKQNKISKMPLELNNKLINSNNNNLNVRFYYSNTYSNKYKKLPSLKTNSISNISSLTSNMNHLTTTNVTMNSVNSRSRPKKLKNLMKLKTFRHNDINLNKKRKTFFKNTFFGNGIKTHYNNNTHNINNINNNNNLNDNIIYSQNFNAKIKTGKNKEIMSSKKKKYSFHKLIKSLGIATDNATKDKVKQYFNKTSSLSKEKDIKNFLYKNKTNMITGKKGNNNNKYLKKK